MNITSRELRRQQVALTAAINKVQEEMATTLSGFETASEPELIEYYIYTYKAQEIKHTYLMKKLKEIYYKD